MSEKLEWRRLYETRTVLFCDGVACGDLYLAGDGIFRVRLWKEDQVTGGRQRFVLSEELARDTLVGMLERAKREAAD